MSKNLPSFLFFLRECLDKNHKSLRMGKFFITTIFIFFLYYAFSFMQNEISYSIGYFQSIKFNVASTNNHTISLFFLFVFFLISVFSLQISEEFSKNIFLLLFYFICNLFVVSAENLISLIIFLEMGSIIVFFVIYKKNVSSSLHYIIMHVLASTLIMIVMPNFPENFSISYLNNEITKTSQQISKIELTSFYVLCIGLLIKSAIFPFSAWLSDSYSKVGYFTMMTLASFGTKATIYAIFKLFAGSSFIIFPGLLTFFYGTLYAFFSSNIRNSALYAMIAQTGVMIALIGTIDQSLKMSQSFVIYIFISLCYQMIFFIASWYAEEDSQNKKQKCPIIWVVSILIGLCSLLGTPNTLSFYIKHDLYNNAFFQNNHYFLSFIFGGNLIFALHYFFLFRGCFSGISFKLKDNTRHICALFVNLALMFCLMPSKYTSEIFSVVFRMPFKLSNNVDFHYFETILISFIFFIFLERIRLKNKINELVDLDWVYRKFLPYIATIIFVLFSDLITIIKKSFKKLYSNLLNYFVDIYSKVALNKIQNSEFTFFIAILFINIYIYFGLLGK